MSSSTEYRLLPGGTANFGRVLRIGDTVRRPRGAHTPAVHALLGHLERTGFAGAPRVLSLDDDSESLTYLEGVAATDPLEEWALSVEVVRAVGGLLREYHTAARAFDARGRVWQRLVPERWRGELVTHNDVNPANVIFRAGRPAALIDFDLAAPATPAWELAVAACFWAPLRHQIDIADSRQGAVAPRMRALLDGYDAPPALRAEVVEACVAANAWIADIIAEAGRNGHPAFGRVWSATSQMYARADRWLRQNRLQLADLVT
ncbi:phosphotransferase [uncultured Jatrophihabitans sp.]|uniref:phosphotransferase n=1 Tax=uncultured Jatrophihabitans sp. TaxID=1610747 RepID=UPI0035CBDBE5